MSTPKGIELQIEIMDDLKRFFSTTPNCLLRGERQPELGLDFRGYSLRARCILGALYSMKSGYRCDRERIDDLAPELGRDGVDTVLKELKKRRNLRTTRINDPDNKGRFIWRWQVSLKPFADEVEDKTAGQSIPGSAGDGSTTDGSAMPGQSGALKDREEPGSSRRTTESFSRSTTDQENSPPTPRAPADGASGQTREGGDGSPSQEEQTRALIAEVKAADPGWRYIDQRTRSALSDPAVKRHPFAVIRLALLELADGKHGPTTSPMRLCELGPDAPWWVSAYRQVAEELSAQNPPPPPAPWCGECEAADYRWVETGEGRLAKCPTCNPHAARTPAGTP